MNSPPKANPGGHTADGMQVGPLGNMEARDIPFSFTSFTDTAMQDRQPVEIQDVLMDDPSILNETSRNSYYNGVLIRGLDASYLHDGQPGVYSRDLVGSYEQFSRVELLKGPNSFVSSNSPMDAGGMINLVPKRATEKPVKDVTFTKLPGSAQKYHVDVGQRFGENNQFGVRVNAVSENGELNVNHLERDRSTFFVALDHRGENHRITLDLEQTSRSTFGAQPWFRVPAGFDVPAAPKLDRTYGQPWAGYEQEQQLFALKGEYDLSSNWTAGAAVSYMDYSEYGQWQGYADITSNNGDYDWKVHSNWEAEPEYQTYRAYTKGQFRTGSIDHNLSLTASRVANQWNAGYGPYKRFVSSNLNDPVYITQPAIAGTNITPQDRDENDYFSVGDKMDVTDRLSVTAGLQWADMANYTLDASGDDTDKSASNAWSPLAGVTYDYTENFTLYGSFAESLQPGERAPSTAANFGETLEATKTRQYQLGNKFDFGQWGGDVALFRTEKKNAFEDPVTKVYKLDGLRRNDGLEVTVFGKPLRNTQITGGMTLLDAELVETAGGANDGNRPIATPEWRATLNMDYQVPSVEGLTYSAALNHTGKQYLDSANNQPVPSWTTADLGASYSFDYAGDRMTAQVDVKNVTNERYWSSSNIGLTPGNPRSLYLSLKTSF